MKSQVMSIAHKLVKANRFYKVAKYSELLSVAMKQAWAQAKAPAVALTAELVKTFSDSIPACFGWIASEKKVEVTFRGKKSDKVFVNLDARKVSFMGNTSTIASQIASQFNLSIAY
ncbi:hypothetical protein [Spirosoma foliorum]|uniref:Uncharacterized protein n=1 Tax=Spirosoma foliorum TaxID=2710596 RepID=A0A7G5H2F1_9BACT|nr:hypothetical protein [Spirosoma foliorum]QMW05293.1 hypothetical protein H3H32_10610 [Spirosoma foliorum]